MPDIFTVGETDSAKNFISFVMVDGAGAFLNGLAIEAQVALSGSAGAAQGSFEQVNSSTFPGLYRYRFHPTELAQEGGGTLFLAAEGAVSYYLEFMIVGGSVYTAGPTTADVADRIIGRSVFGSVDGGFTIGQALRGEYRVEFDPNSSRYSFKAPDGVAILREGTYTVEEDGTVSMVPDP